MKVTVFSEEDIKALIETTVNATLQTFLNNNSPVTTTENENYYTVDDAKVKLHIKTDATIYRLIREKEIEAKQFGRKWLIKKSSIDNFKGGKRK